MCTNVYVCRYVCDCTNTGYEGRQCQTQVDECAQWRPCQHGATCVDHLGNYTCLCSSDYAGRNCSVRLTACDGGSVCSNNGTCTPKLIDETLNVQNFTCSCRQGFAGSRCEICPTPYYGPTCKSGEYR